MHLEPDLFLAFEVACDLDQEVTDRSALPAYRENCDVCGCHGLMVARRVRGQSSGQARKPRGETEEGKSRSGEAEVRDRGGESRSGEAGKREPERRLEPEEPEQRNRSRRVGAEARVAQATIVRAPGAAERLISSKTPM